MLLKTLMLNASLMIVCCGAGCTEIKTKPANTPPEESTQPLPTLDTDASIKEIFFVKLVTSKGDIVIEVHPEWAPIGATRFHKLVEAKYYDGCRFFRVIDHFVAQTGINGDPATSALWRDKNLQTEEVKQSNLTGFLSFAQGGDNPNTRTTQFFINYSDDNKKLDAMHFPPFGKVIKGMDVAKSFYSGYNPESISQQSLSYEGNSYLELNFPKLDYIKTARIVTAEMNK